MTHAEGLLTPSYQGQLARVSAMMTLCDAPRSFLAGQELSIKTLQATACCVDEWAGPNEAVGWAFSCKIVFDKSTAKLFAASFVSEHKLHVLYHVNISARQKQVYAVSRGSHVTHLCLVSMEKCLYIYIQLVAGIIADGFHQHDAMLQHNNLLIR